MRFPIKRTYSSLIKRQQPADGGESAVSPPFSPYFLTSLLPMLAFLYNLFIVTTKVPAAIGILKTIIDLCGAKSLIEVLQILGDAVQFVRIENPDTPETPAGQKRLLQRLKERIAGRLLGLTDIELSAVKNAFSENQTA